MCYPIYDKYTISWHCFMMWLISNKIDDGKEKKTLLKTNFLMLMVLLFIYHYL
jgi:hypothetical protein